MSNRTRHKVFNAIKAPFMLDTVGNWDATIKQSLNRTGVAVHSGTAHSGHHHLTTRNMPDAINASQTHNYNKLIKSMTTTHQQKIYGIILLVFKRRHRLSITIIVSNVFIIQYHQLPSIYASNP